MYKFALACAFISLLASSCIRSAPMTAAPARPGAQVPKSPDLQQYENLRFGLAFSYPKNFVVTEQYPATWPATNSPSADEPYIIDLYAAKDERYPLIQFNVLPKSAWGKTKQQIIAQTGTYAYTFSAESEALRLNGTTAYLYTGNYSPYLYCFEHPSLPYMFTVRFVDPPTAPTEMVVFYNILNSIQFPNP